MSVDLEDLLAAWEPHDVRLKLSVTRSFAVALDRVCADLRLSKSLVLREAVRRGLPALVNDVVYLRSQGVPVGCASRGALGVDWAAWTEGGGCGFGALVGAPGRRVARACGAGSVGR